MGLKRSVKKFESLPDRAARFDTIDTRCSGCGNTPCLLDRNGCCPAQPAYNPLHDDSWGDSDSDPPG